MKSIDDAIKHCKEKAEELERRAEEVAMNDAEGVYQPQVARCRDCASDHRQLAEWLKELKDYRDARVGCEYCKHKFREQHERPCSLCQRNFVDKFEREVNADEESE